MSNRKRVPQRTTESGPQPEIEAARASRALNSSVAALRMAVELILDEAQQLRPSAGLRVHEEAGSVLPHQAVQPDLLGAVAIVVDRRGIRRPLRLPTVACTMGLR
jgi:hypothetical protein